MSRRLDNFITYWSRTRSLGCSAIICTAHAAPRHARTRLQRHHVFVLQEAVDTELEERRRAFDRADELLWIFLEHVRGVTAGGKIGDLELHFETLFPLVAALGRSLTGGVGVVHERDLARQVLQREEVVVGERGAARRATTVGTPAR